MHIMHQNFCNVVKRNINQTSHTSKNDKEGLFFVLFVDASDSELVKRLSWNNIFRFI